MKKVIFDSSALISACKYSLGEKRICEHLMEYVEIHIPTAVRDELLKPAEEFPENKFLRNLIAQNKIIVDTVDREMKIAKQLASAELGAGEREAIILYYQNPEIEVVVVDDYFASFICSLRQVASELLLDLIINLVRDQHISNDMAKTLTAKIARRYDKSHIELSYFILEVLKDDKHPWYSIIGTPLKMYERNRL